MWIQTAPKMTGDWWTDFFYTITIIIPNVAAVLLAFMALRQSRENGRKLNQVDRTLNGKVDDSAKIQLPVDKLR